MIARRPGTEFPRVELFISGMTSFRIEPIVTKICTLVTPLNTSFERLSISTWK